MIQAFLNIFKIPELRNKLLFTLGMLTIYRVGFWIPGAVVFLGGARSRRSRAEVLRKCGEVGQVDRPVAVQVAGFIFLRIAGFVGRSEPKATRKDGEVG